MRRVDQDRALRILRTVIAQYPRDRVVRNDRGRILFLQKKLPGSDREIPIRLTIDPEDLQAHYNLMLCYNGLGQKDRAEEHEKRYFALQRRMSPRRRSPGRNRINHRKITNERQAIH